MSVKQSLLGCLSRFDGFREALPGEFTKRALINNKLDLLQAEGVNALINAESAADRELCL
jgi:tRNA modification GTPase